MKILDRPAAAVAPDRFSLERIPPTETGESFSEAVAHGLRADPKTLPCRFFYDERGSLLFEQITQLEEYYPTRAETEILAENAREIAQAAGTAPELIELGSGSATKTRLLIEALTRLHGPLVFRPIDISPTILETSSRALLDDHKSLTIRAIAAEYDAGLERVARTRTTRSRLVAWLGSSIGNLSREAASDFLARVRRTLRRDDRMLIGIDRRKNAQTLERAYDDDQGVTAQFNLNLLRRANRELQADFDLEQFEHRARWCDSVGRVEMHLVSRTDQQVRIEGETYDFASGESIHTESSYKYSRTEIEDLATRSGLRQERRWTDAGERFELALLAPA